MNWILIVIISYTYGSSNNKTVAVTSIPFQSKSLCEKAAEKIDTPSEFRSTTTCVRVHSKDIGEDL